jgi:hypothetical protein
MMETNSNDPVTNDDKEVTEDDLRSLKYPDAEVEPSQEEDESAEDTEDEAEDSEDTGDDSNAESEDDEQSDSSEEPSFVKKFPNIKGDTPEEYARNVEIAYEQSTAEALRLKGIAEAPSTAPEIGKPDVEDKPSVSSPLELYAQQKLDSEIAEAYAKFSKDYPQVTDPVDYNRFTVEVATLSNTIYQSQKRLASPDELYTKAAIILGWEKDSSPSNKEKLAMAVKNSAASSKPASASGAKGSSKSKVTDEMIRVNRAMYPGKSDSDIRKELEPYVQ